MPILIIISFLLAPAYAVRFPIFNLPTDVLMVWMFLFWLIFFIWLLVKKQLSEFLSSIKSLDKKFLIFICLFFLSGLISLLINDIDRAKLGQFIVLFLQPIPTFFIARYIFKQSPKATYYLLLTTYSLLAIAGIFAVIQYFTLSGLPQEFWGNSVEPKRALAFFIHPNFYALWSAPLLALLIPDLGQRLKNLKKDWCYIAAWILGAIGLLLSFSRAGWLGLSVAVLIYLIFAADKKIRKIALGAVIVMIIVIVSTPNLRWRFILPFYGERSASSRTELWQSGWKGIKQSPIFGLGLNGYSNNYRTLQTDTTLPDHNFPHNIFLDLWVEIGLIGLVSFIGITFIVLRQGFKNRNDAIKLGVALFFIALLVQGQIDNPYFKNDLALVFWTVLALI